MAVSNPSVNRSQSSLTKFLEMTLVVNVDRVIVIVTQVLISYDLMILHYFFCVVNIFCEHSVLW